MKKLPDDMPPLPQNVSADGREIWDWAAKLGRYTALLQKRRDLREQIASVTNKCGSCVKWMTDFCPRETHDNTKGRRSGPHMDMSACKQFMQTKMTTGLLEEWNAELAKVHEQIAGG